MQNIINSLYNIQKTDQDKRIDEDEIIDNNNNDSNDDVDGEKEDLLINYMDYDIKNIITRINGLTAKEKIHILKILNSYNIQYSQNSNGYFFNLADVNNVILSQICNCLTLIEENRDILKQMNDKREKMIFHYKNLIEDQLKLSVKNKSDVYKNSLLLKNDSKNIVIKINKKKKSYINKNNHTLDPDEMIKIFHKSINNFIKDSVHHRIFVRIKNKNRKKERFVEANDESDILINADGENEDNEINENDIVEDIDDKESLKDETVDDEDNDILDKDKDDEVDICEDIDIEVNDIFEEEPENESDNETDINEELNQTETDQLQSELDEKIKNKKIYEKQMLYFQTLLHKKGFQFDENEKCILRKESYLL